MTVVVVGGGVAGLATALALHRAGHRPVVLDAESRAGHEPADHGRLHLNPAAQRTFTELGVGHSIQTAGFPVAAIEVRTSDGEPFGEFPAEGGDYRYVTRHELLARLTAECRTRGLDIRHSHRVTALPPTNTGQLVVTADHDDMDADLVVGADGPRSLVRDTITPAVSAQYIGHWFVHGQTPQSETPFPSDYDKTVHVIRDPRTAAAFGWTVDAHSTLHWWLRITSADPPHAELVDHVTHHPSALSEWAPRRQNGASVPGVHAALTAAQTPVAVYVPSTVDPSTARWFDRERVLVGDAVHACSPAASWAAALAAEDALTLGLALRDQPTEHALSLYQQLRQTRAARAIAAGNPRNGISPGPPYELSWNTTLNSEMAEHIQRRYRF